MTASQGHLDLGFDEQPPLQLTQETRIPQLLTAREPTGVVYTQPWVADLILDLIGYRADQDLAVCYAVEPSAGQGAFLRPMIRRLLKSLAAHGRGLGDALESIRAYELDPDSARRAVEVAELELLQHGAAPAEARALAAGWVEVGDYLLASHGGRRADFVVGNPPYIRYDDIPVDALAAYRGLYPTMTGRGDIYVGLIEAGLPVSLWPPRPVRRQSHFLGHRPTSASSLPLLTPMPGPSSTRAPELTVRGARVAGAGCTGRAMGI